MSSNPRGLIDIPLESPLALDWSAAGDKLAIGLTNGSVATVSFDGRTLDAVVAAGLGSPVTAVSWSPSGHLLAFGTEVGNLAVMLPARGSDPGEGDPKFSVKTGCWSSIGAIRWIDDGALVAAFGTELSRFDLIG